MAAPQLSVFLPGDVNNHAVLARIVEALSLSVDHVPAGFPFEFTAQLRTNNIYILIEHDSEVIDIIGEMMEWEMPTEEYKSLLSDCKSSINIHYRGIDYAKNCLLTLSDAVGDASSRCIVENNEGCLLRLSDVARLMTGNPTWTWERGEFPEIPGVGSSEWRDSE